MMTTNSTIDATKTLNQAPLYWLSVVNKKIPLQPNEEHFTCNNMMMSVQPLNNLNFSMNQARTLDYLPGIPVDYRQHRDTQDNLCRAFSSSFELNFKKQNFSYTNFFKFIVESSFFKKYLSLLFGSYTLLFIVSFLEVI